MILTVTPNTALDVTYRVPALLPHATHRVTEVTERSGGEGLDVARVLAALGHEVTVTGFAGGPTGRVVRERLTGVTDALVPCAAPTRRTLTVADERTGQTTRFDEPGPVVTPAEWSAFQETYERLLDGVDAVALCGSLPPGVPVGAYGVLVRTARAAGVPVLLDTGGEALRRAVAARPDLIKPNAGELAELTGSHEPSRATQDARRRGARSVVASLGAQGLVAATPEGRWRAVPPARPLGGPRSRRHGTPAGTGAAVSAGLLSGLAERLPWPGTLARAVALSAATALSPTPGEFDRAAYADLLDRVAVTGEVTAA
ncbi:1-phosphofructokinase family hexose kinase [Streptomyces sp. NPDC057052]|uniref:1-phosphofructokinase family hexose kinase n=1 Tax=Streptomyces sp. NPDC057052 TaxID=3346010 RepID=UPI003636D482